MLWRAVRYVNARASLQLRVLRRGFLQDKDVGVGVFPEREEVFVSGERSNAGGVGRGRHFPHPRYWQVLTERVRALLEV
jgi:hypothetical protein